MGIMRLSTLSSREIIIRKLDFVVIHGGAAKWKSLHSAEKIPSYRILSIVQCPSLK